MPESSTRENQESATTIIRTPDQRLRVFVSSTLKELAEEREAVRRAIIALRLIPVLFELGARPHAARNLYRAYLAQSHVFVGIYWQQYGWVAPGEDVSGLEDEYRLAADLPKLIYIKTPAPDREPDLVALLQKIKNEEDVSYKYFSDSAKLQELIANDLAVLLTERFEQAGHRPATPAPGAWERVNGRPALPRPLTTLIGREADVQGVRSLLARPNVRLVTLSGPGGVGKTRLSLEAVNGLEELFEHGIYWVSLAAIREPELVTYAIAQALDVRERGGYPLLDTLKEYLRTRRLLLLLDNFEQVIAAGPILAEILAAAPGLKALVTSRAPLHVRGEHEFPVPPLQLPERSLPHSLERLLQNAAIRLFVERAQAAYPAFALSRENAADVVEIVRRLDGLPLAIELAAARIKMIPPRSILSRFESRLRLLTGGAKDLPPRQQTIRSTIDWSYSLLEQETQTLFSRLSVFVDGFTIEAAEAVCNQDGELNVFDGVATLLDNSLLQQDHPRGEQPRFSMLETISEYALEKLIEAGAEDLLRQQHALFFSELAAEAGPTLYSGASEAWLDRLEVEYSNFRAALAWLLADSHLMKIGWQALVALQWLWYRRGYLNEARQWFETAIEQAAALGDEPLRASILENAGAIAMWQGDLTNAARLMDEGLLILRRCGQPFHLASPLFSRGVLAVHQGDAQKAQALLDEALPLFQQIGQEWFQAMTLLHLGNVALRQSDVTTARVRTDESFTLGKRVGDNWIVASAVNNFGEIARYQGAYGEAENHYLESKALFGSVGSTPDVARENHSLGYVALSRGQYNRACALFEESLDQHQKLGVRRGVVECLVGLAAAMSARGQAEEAARLLATARTQFAALGAAIWPADNADFERALAAARSRLDDSTFTAAWESGQSLSLEQALAAACA